jgi:hypothetical protein
MVSRYDRRSFVLQLQEGGWHRLEGHRLVSLLYSLLLDPTRLLPASCPSILSSFLFPSINISSTRFPLCFPISISTSYSISSSSSLLIQSLCFHDQSTKYLFPDVPFHSPCGILLLWTGSTPNPNPVPNRSLRGSPSTSESRG